MMLRTTRQGVTLLQFERLARVGGVLHFVSTRSGGVSQFPYNSLNLSLQVGEDAALVRQNRQRLASALGLESSQFVSPTQVHGSDVAIIASRDRSGAISDPVAAVPDADALITDVPGVVPMLMSADCVLVLLCDPIHRVVGIAHAGWRGTLQRVVTATVRRMISEFGSEPRDLVAGLTPSIGPCCYEVDTDVLRQVQATFPYWRSLLRPHPNRNKAFLDLWHANHAQLIESGLGPEQIESAATCTKCHTDTFYSDRARRPTGRFAAGIMLMDR